MEVVKIDTEHIKLGQFLKFVGAVSMGGEVKGFLANTTIKVNEKEAKERGKKLFPGDIVEFDDQKFIIEGLKCWYKN